MEVLKNITFFTIPKALIARNSAESSHVFAKSPILRKKSAKQLNKHKYSRNGNEMREEERNEKQNIKNNL